jgi:hypothetical protein
MVTVTHEEGTQSLPEHVTDTIRAEPATTADENGGEEVRQ